MTDSRNHLVKNLSNEPCRNCTGIHEYISRGSDHAPCGTPVAWSLERANDIAKSQKLDLEEAVVVVPDDTLVVLDDSARKLRKQGDGIVPLDQSYATMRMV